MLSGTCRSSVLQRRGQQRIVQWLRSRRIIRRYSFHSPSLYKEMYREFNWFRSAEKGELKMCYVIGNSSHCICRWPGLPPLIGEWRLGAGLVKTLTSGRVDCSDMNDSLRRWKRSQKCSEVPQEQEILQQLEEQSCLEASDRIVQGCRKICKPKSPLPILHFQSQ